MIARLHVEGRYASASAVSALPLSDEQWNRIETAVANSKQSPDRLLVLLEMEALDRRERPRSELDIRLMRSTRFTAQAMARNMIAEGREVDVRG